MTLLIIPGHFHFLDHFHYLKVLLMSTFWHSSNFSGLGRKRLMAVRVTLMAIFCLTMTIYMWRNIKQVEDEDFVVLRLLKDWVWVWGLGLSKETTKETWEWWMSCLHVWFVTLGMGMLALQRWHNVPQELFMWNLLLLAISAYGQWCFLHILIHFMKQKFPAVSFL